MHAGLEEAAQGGAVGGEVGDDVRDVRRAVRLPHLLERGLVGQQLEDLLLDAGEIHARLEAASAPAFAGPAVVSVKVGVPDLGGVEGVVLADHAADRGGRPDAGAPFERDDIGIGRAAEQDFGVEEGADVVLHADGGRAVPFPGAAGWGPALPEDAEGVEADPRLLVDRADDADARPEHPFAGDVVFPQQADAGVGELFEKCSAS